MYIRRRDLKSISRLWCELSEFPASQCEEALTYSLERLTHIIGACNASWMAAVRETELTSGDPMQGWWPHDIHVLHDAEKHARQNEAILEQFETDVIDPQSAAMIAHAGRTRVQLRSDLVDDTVWERSWLYQEILRPVQIEDRLVGAHSVNRFAESYFALDRGRNDAPFDDRARDVFALFLSGIPTFHQEQLRMRGLLDTSSKLTRREQDVMRLLLTDRSEPVIADELGLAFHTTHHYVRSIYRKFNVQGRGPLAARWLRYRPQVREHRDPGDSDPRTSSTS